MNETANYNLQNSKTSCSAMFPRQLDNELFRQVFNIRPVSGYTHDCLTHTDLHICEHQRHK